MTVKTIPEVEKFIASLEKSTIERILRTIDLLEKFGFRLGMPQSKKVTSELYELRIRGRQEVRIFYTFYRSEIILLHGFVKKSDKTPTREITTAAARLRVLTQT